MNVKNSINEFQVKRRVDSASTSSGGQNRERSRSSNPNLSSYNVEFINPKGRDDSDRGGGSVDHTVAAGEGPGSDANPVPDDDWVWLTSYSRIPVSG